MKNFILIMIALVLQNVAQATVCNSQDKDTFKVIATSELSFEYLMTKFGCGNNLKCILVL